MDRQFCQYCEEQLVSFRLYSVTRAEAKAIGKDKRLADKHIPYFFGYLCVKCSKEADQFTDILALIKKLGYAVTGGF